MNKRLLLILLVVVLVLPAGVVLADSNTSTAIYRATIMVSNNSTATENVATVFTGNTTAWMAVNYLSDTATDTAMLSSAGGDLTYMPGYIGYPWVVWVPAIGGDSYINDYLYMGGGTDMGGKIRYFPGLGGMTVKYDDSLVFTDNFTLEISGWFDATASGNITSIEDAFGIVADGSGNITSYLDIDDTKTDILRPSSNGTYTQIPVQYPDSGYHYQKVDEASPDGNDTYVENDVYAVKYDTYELPSWSPTNLISIDYVEVTMRVKKDNHQGSPGGTPTDGEFYAMLYLGGSIKLGTNRFSAVSTDWVTFTETLARPSGGDWSEEDINNLEVGVRLTPKQTEEYQYANHYCTQLYITVHYTTGVVVSATGIDSDEHTIRVWADGTNFHISVDKAVTPPLYKSAALNGARVPDNDYDRVFFTNYVMIYVEYVKIWVPR